MDQSLSLLHRAKRELVNNTKDLVFQALSWYAEDVLEDESDEQQTSKYVIKVFGSTSEGKTVGVTVKDFTPYFYVKVPLNWGRNEEKKFREFFMNSYPSKDARTKYEIESSIVSIKMLERKDFWGFSNGQTFKFIRLCFKNLKSMRIVQRLFNYDLQIRSISTSKIRFKVYESNIDPFIRFIHINDLEPCGWLRLPAKTYSKSTDTLTSTCNIDVEVKWTFVEKFKCDDTSPMVIASFDIECTSSTGEFPVPVKADYKQLCSNLYDVYKDTLESQTEYKRKEGIVEAILYAINVNQSCSVPGMHRQEIKEDLTDERKTFIRDNIKQVVDDIATVLSGKLSLDSGEKPTREKIVAVLVKLFKNEKWKMPPLKGDAIIQIGTTVHVYGSRECSFKHILTLGSCNPIEGVVVEQCQTEDELLLKWTDLMQQLNPDVVTGYNIFGFDFWYMSERARELEIHRNFMKLSRIQNKTCNFEVKQLSSSALGDNFLKFIDMEGRVLIDLMKVIQRDHKLDSYKLDNVAHHFMNMNKHDVPPQTIFKLQKGTADDRKIIAEYCVQDCALCNNLMIKLEIMANNMGMSNVCLVPLSFIFMRGQGIKIFSLVLKQCKEDGFLIPVVRPPFKKEEDEESTEDSYEGAIVLEPKDGIYIDDPVSVLDYASLYPSSMISENLSHDCIVLDKQYDNLPGVEYLDISYDIYEGVGDKKVRVGEQVCRFVQPPNGEKGIIPNILMKLLKARKTTRKKIEIQTVTLVDGKSYKGFYDEKTSTITQEDGIKIEVSKDLVQKVEDCYNEFQKAVLDGLQVAYKVTANSLYGQIGARTSPIYMKDIAACTTATGRKMIMIAKTFLEENYNANIVYGDSVTSYTPIIIKDVSGNIVIDSIENIGNNYGNGWISCIENGKQGKEGTETPGILTWTDKGWTELKRVIRHQLAPHKQILRVLTHTGVVDVTDDHSLIRANHDIVKPTEIQQGDSLLHADLPSNFQLCNIEEDEAQQMGMTSKIVPSVILNAPLNIKKAFWEGFYNANGSTDVHGNTVFEQDSQLSAATIYMFAQNIGYKVSIKCIDLMYHITCASHSYYKNSDVVSKIHPIEYNGYVYDLTTENHHFAAGVGRMVVHNTDSIFIVFPNTTFETELDMSHDQAQILKGKQKIMPSIKTAIKASNEIKALLKKPHDLEYEKTFWPFILLSKKRYVGNLYEHDDKKCKQKSMGIVLKRRDNANIVKRVYGGIIDTILNRQDVPASLDFLKQSLNDLVEGKCPMEDLIITKSLRSEYKDPTKIAHKVLAERMGERDPGNKPQVNDRIPFVYVSSSTSDKKEKLLQGERIEHPDYIKEHNLQPDYNFYITNQIMKPVLQLYAIIVEQLPGFHKPKEYYKMISDKLLEETQDEKKIKERLYQVKENDVKELLFDPILSKLDNFKKTSTRVAKKLEKEMIEAQLLEGTFQKKPRKRVSKEKPKAQEEETKEDTKPTTTTEKPVVKKQPTKKSTRAQSKKVLEPKKDQIESTEVPIPTEPTAVPSEAPSQAPQAEDKPKRKTVVRRKKEST